MSGRGKRIRRDVTRRKEEAARHDPRAGGALNDPACVAEYIGDLAEELRKLAETARLPFLAYLLELAHEEAKARRSGCA